MANLWTDRQRIATSAGPSRRIAAPAVAIVLAMTVLLGPAASALASQSQSIIEKCGHGEAIGGYPQSAYREALKHLPTELSEYSPCENQIRTAELAAAGAGNGTAPVSSAPPNVALPLSPSEQKAVKSAHNRGSAPVRIGSEPVQPGVVHADIASAVNTLPHSLFAMIALLIAGAVALGAREVYRRVSTRGDR